MRHLPSPLHTRLLLSCVCAVALIAPNAGCFTILGLASGARGQSLSNLAQADAIVATAVVGGAINAATRAQRRAREVEASDLQAPDDPTSLGFPADANGDFCGQISVAVRHRVPHRLATPTVNDDGLMVVELDEREEQAYLTGAGLDFDVCGRHVIARNTDRRSAGRRGAGRQGNRSPVAQ